MSRPLVAGTGAVGASLATLLVAGAGQHAVASGLLGVLVTTIGVLLGRRPPVTVGAVCLFATVVFAGLTATPPIALLAGTVSAVLAWTLGGTAVELSTGFDGAADTVVLEATRAAGLLVLVGGIAGVVFLLSALPTGDAPPVASVLLLVGGVLLARSVQ